MCNDCSLSVCPDACPEKRLAEFDTCRICGEPILAGDEHYAHGNARVCLSCADSLTVDDLMDLCDLRDTDEFLSVLGFRHV